MQPSDFELPHHSPHHADLFDEAKVELLRLAEILNITVSDFWSLKTYPPERDVDFPRYRTAFERYDNLTIHDLLVMYRQAVRTDINADQYLIHLRETIDEASRSWHFKDNKNPFAVLVKLYQGIH
jgi:hypothetical protein